MAARGLGRAAGARARRCSSRLGARIDPDAAVSSLGMAEQQLVEIARAIGAQARVLIMDEPTASLAEQEVRHLHRVVRELRAQGAGIVYITHRLEELLRPGRPRHRPARRDAAWPPDPWPRWTRADLIRMMVGPRAGRGVPQARRSAGRRRARGARRLVRGGRASATSPSTCGPGEIFGLCRPRGRRAGPSWRARSSAWSPADGGEVRLRGGRVRLDLARRGAPRTAWPTCPRTGGGTA